jgi:transposase
VSATDGDSRLRRTAVAVPWAEKYARFSRLFERLAIDVMQECSIRGACELLRISWDEADGIKQRAVQRGLARKQPVVMPRLCVDEKGMVRGHNYLTIVARAEAGRTTVEYELARTRQLPGENYPTSPNAWLNPATPPKLKG